MVGKSLEEKEAAAEAKWHRDFRNVEIIRRGSGADTQLGVAGLPRTEGFGQRESRRQVACSDSMHTKTEMYVSNLSPSMELLRALGREKPWETLVLSSHTVHRARILTLLRNLCHLALRQRCRHRVRSRHSRATNDLFPARAACLATKKKPWSCCL